MSARPALRALARRLGVEDGYESAKDRCWHETSDATRAALVAAMGHACDDEAAAGRALEALEALLRERWLEPSRVARQAELQRSGLLLAEHVVGGAGAHFDATIRSDAGGEPLRISGQLASGAGAAIPLPQPLALGEYELEVELRGARAGARCSKQRLIVVPEAALDPAACVGSGGAYGLIAQLYLLRDRDGWGAGDLGTLRRLCELAGAEGAAFVGLNPLHALANRVGRVCPYSPLSRLHRSVVYLELEAIAEWDRCEQARRLASEGAMAAERARLRAGERIDLPAVARAKRAVLERLFDCSEQGAAARMGTRSSDFTRPLASADASVEGFASYLAIAEELERRPGSTRDPWDWRSWPQALRDPTSEAVRRFRREHARAIRFHVWCQNELDRQLEAAAGHARACGLHLGLYTDLALGGVSGGSDEWLHQALFADASTGAPPDDFAPAGQDWCLPPLDPHALAADGYRFWHRLLATNFRHAGALRLDHALSLRRLFWIPRGRPASEGGYVAYPELDLLGVLALESLRAGAVVIGEDLGTVPSGFRERMQEHGLLSSRVLLFERDSAGLRPAAAYPRLALATASTHDLPPLAAWRGEEDLLLRRRVGQIEDDDALARERAAREALRAALRAGLAAEHEGSPGSDPLQSSERLAAAVTAFLCRSPALLVGIAVDDLTGEREPLNLPGIAPSVYESWRRPIGVTIEEIASHPIARATFAAIPPGRRGGAAQGAPSDSSSRGSKTERTTSDQA